MPYHHNDYCSPLAHILRSEVRKRAAALAAEQAAARPIPVPASPTPPITSVRNHVTRRQWVAYLRATDQRRTWGESDAHSFGPPKPLMPRSSTIPKRDIPRPQPVERPPINCQ